MFVWNMRARGWNKCFPSRNIGHSWSIHCDLCWWLGSWCGWWATSEFDGVYAIGAMVWRVRRSSPAGRALLVYFVLLFIYTMKQQAEIGRSVSGYFRVLSMLCSCVVTWFYMCTDGGSPSATRFCCIILLVVSGSRSCTWFNMAMFLGTNRRSERGTQTVLGFGPEPNIAQQKSHEVFIEEAIQQHTVFLVKLNSQHQDDWNELVFAKWIIFAGQPLGHNMWSHIWFLVILRQFHRIPRLTKSLRLWMFDAAQKELFRVTKVGPGWVPFLGWEIKDDKHAKVFSLIHMETGSFMMNM